MAAVAAALATSHQPGSNWNLTPWMGQMIQIRSSESSCQACGTLQHRRLALPDGARIPAAGSATRRAP